MGVSLKKISLALLVQVPKLPVAMLPRPAALLAPRFTRDNMQIGKCTGTCACKSRDITCADGSVRNARLHDWTFERR